MMYVGIDVSSKSFVVHAIDRQKRSVFQGEIPPTRTALLKLIGDLGPEPKKVVFEAGNQMKWLAETLLKCDSVDLHVVHPNELKWISKSSSKTDKVDARKMAELARGDLLPRKVHIVEGPVRRLRELASARQTVQSKRIALANSIRALLLQEGVRLAEKFFGRTDWRERLDRVPVSDTGRIVITAYMQAIDALQATEIELTGQIVAVKDKRLELLESIPGIGLLTSRVLLGAIDDAQRFDDRKAVGKYGALTPTIYQSGSVTHLGRVNRDGRHEIRRVLLQCAHTVGRMKSFESRPLRQFFERLVKRRGKKIAVVALARKLLTIAYGVLKNQAYYDPSRLTSYTA
jgi:transposase